MPKTREAVKKNSGKQDKPETTHIFYHFFNGAKIEKLLRQKKAPGTTPGLKPNPLEPTHPFPNGLGGNHNP